MLFVCLSHFTTSLGALGDFGKHVPKASEEKSDGLFHSLFGDASGVDMEQATKLMSELLPGDGSEEFSPPEGLDGFDNIFSEEFAKAAEAQMKEAFELLSKENPDLLRQFEEFAPELTGAGKTTSDPSGGEKRTSPAQQKQGASTEASSCDADVKQSVKQPCGEGEGELETCTSGGEGRKEAGSGVGGGKGPLGAGGGAAAPDLHSAVDKALKSMQQNAENVGKVRRPPFSRATCTARLGDTCLHNCNTDVPLATLALSVLTAGSIHFHEHRGCPVHWLRLPAVVF